MAELRVLNELGINETLLVLEPMRECVAKCPYCYVKLNRLARGDGTDGVGTPSDDTGSFETRVERAFGPGHDPADFEEWAIRNRLPLVFASTVEPFGDVAQARGLLRLFRRLDLPVFFQTKGVNWREVWDDVLPLAGNAGMYVSFPTDDDAVLRDFEPGTPPASERRELVAAACAAGIPVMLAVAPYHPGWCADLPGHVAGLLELGVESVFLDSLHLSPKQGEALGRSRQRHAARTLDAAETAWGPEFIAQAHAARDLCVAAGAGFDVADLRGPRHSLDPVLPLAPIPYRRATPWPYADSAYLRAALAQHAAGERAGDERPILVRWGDALACMEGQPGVDARAYDQPFTWASMRRWLLQVKKLPAQWQRVLQPAAPVREHLRALWNQPKGGPGWRHPFTRVAVREDGSPHLDGAGNVAMVFDPYWADKRQERVVPDLGACRPLEWKGE